MDARLAEERGARWPSAIFSGEAQCNMVACRRANAHLACATRPAQQVARYRLARVAIESRQLSLSEAINDIICRLLFCRLLVLVTAFCQPHTTCGSELSD